MVSTLASGGTSAGAKAGAKVATKRVTKAATKAKKAVKPAAVSQASKPCYNALLKQAQDRYPKLAGIIQKHHIDPIFMGGAKDGPISFMDAAFHQLITNEFRRLHPYGKGPLSLEKRMAIMKEVYDKYPLPPGSIKK